MISQHPSDIPGHLTRGEIWSRISIALLLGVSLAVAKSNADKVSHPALRGLGSASRGWDAARRRQQQIAPSKKFKPGPFDHWTDEELFEKALNLIMGTERVYESGAWHDLDRAYSISNQNRSDKQTCYATKNHIERAVSSISMAKRINDTGRIARLHRSGINFKMLGDRVAEAIAAYERTCGTYDGPSFP